MELGKFSNEKLKKIILDKIPHLQEDVVIRPGIGEDCCAVKVGDELCVLSTDPITAGVAEVGTLAVHITANDIASAGVSPIAMLVTMLIPPTATEEDIERVVTQITDTAKALNIEIVGGHTEVTDAVNRIVVSTTALGKGKVMITTAGAQIGDDIVLTKYAGIEGSAIILADHADKIDLTEDEMKALQSLAKNISVVKEGMIGARCHVHAMHDVTEGGVLGAIHELCEAAWLGAIVYEEKIPIAPVTQKICNHLGINPLRLISSGSMLMTTDRADELIGQLAAAGVYATVIGKITESNIILQTQQGTQEIDPPGSDELYRIMYL